MLINSLPGQQSVCRQEFGEYEEINQPKSELDANYIYLHVS